MFHAGYGATRADSSGGLTGDDMVFEDSSQAASRYSGEGFRLEPEFRDPTAPTVPVVGGQLVDAPEPTITLTKRSAPPLLEFVFDDPEDGEPGKDRILVHVLWEVVLLLAVAGVGYLLYRTESSVFSGPNLHQLLLPATVLGIATMGMALSLRAGAPNLAIGAVTAAAAVYYVEHSSGGVTSTWLAIIGLAAAVGAVQGLAVVGLHVPGWAAGIGAAVTVLAWAETTPQAAPSGVHFQDPTSFAWWWFGGFAAVSLIGAGVGLVPPIRRAVGRFRPVSDPANRRRLLAALITFGATVGSSILAAVAGVLAVNYGAAVEQHQLAASPPESFIFAALVLGAALLGGTSAFGRRGGILGTVLAVSLVTVGQAYAERTHPSWPDAAFAAVAIAIGLAVTRLVERFGRPMPSRAQEADDDWAPRVHSAVPASTGWATGSRTPVQNGVGGIWASDDAWGTSDRG
jgi:ribose/xylose/arabinose/galactoside ABC-type transport system permease subunit